MGGRHGGGGAGQRAHEAVDGGARASRGVGEGASADAWNPAEGVCCGGWGVALQKDGVVAVAAQGRTPQPALQWLLSVGWWGRRGCKRPGMGQRKALPAGGCKKRL